jgi:hypothetical protein
MRIRHGGQFDHLVCPVNAARRLDGQRAVAIDLVIPFVLTA